MKPDIPFDSPQKIASLLADLPPPDQAAVAAARTHQANLTKPPHALGRLEDIAIWLAGWQNTGMPQAPTAPHCLVFAGNHGVTSHGVSAYPSAVTAQMVANFRTGGAAINQLTQAAGVPLTVHPIHLAQATGDIATTTAMSISDTLAAMQTGADAIPHNCDMLLLGEMGIGNTTPASALACAILGGEAADWTGAGSGLDADGVAHKASIIAKATQRHYRHQRDAGTGTSTGDNRDPVALLASLGGYELAAIAGATLMARLRRIPVLLDGFVASCACLPLWAANPQALAHCQISHLSAEAAHRAILARLGMTALCDLNMRLGEASGAAVAFVLVKLALAVHTGMATFAEAGVATKHQAGHQT